MNSICKICSYNCITIRKLSNHIKNQHNVTPEQYYRQYYIISGEDICENCGKPLKFIKLTKPFMKTCSKKCFGQNQLTKKRRNQTNIKRFGTENPYQSEQVKQKIKDTINKKYGGLGLSSTIIRNKIISTNLKRYGTNNPWKSKSIINKLKVNKLNKIKQFEIDNDCTEKQELINQYGASWLSIEKDLDCLWLDNNHKFIKNYEIDKIKLLGPKFCRHALNDLEIEIFNFVKSIYSDEIRQNDRKVLDGKELDLYLPKIKIGIEIDGDYWHSDLYKKYDFHYNKSNLCRKKGIRLIHIQEFIWKKDSNVYKNYLIKIVNHRNYFEIESQDNKYITLDYNLGLPQSIKNYKVYKFSGPIKLNNDNYIIYGCGNVIYKKIERNLTNGKTTKSV